MARLNGVNFNAADYDPTQSAGSLPVGVHPVVVKSSEVVATKDQSGGMLILTLEVIDGPNKGLTGPYRLNLFNQSQEAVKIAFQQLSALCHVIGVPGLADDTTPLHGKPFQVLVQMQTGSDKYTEIKGVKTISGDDPKRGVFNAVQGQGGAPQPQGNQPPQGFSNQSPQQQQAPAPQQQQPQQSWQQPAQGSAPAPQWQQPAQGQAPAPAPASGGWQQGGNSGGNSAPWGQK